jgi:hypothetical protein
MEAAEARSVNSVLELEKRDRREGCARRARRSMPMVISGIRAGRRAARKGRAERNAEEGRIAQNGRRDQALYLLSSSREHRFSRGREMSIRALSRYARNPHGYWLESRFEGQKSANLMDCFFKNEARRLLKRKAKTKSVRKTKLRSKETGRMSYDQDVAVGALASLPGFRPGALVIGDHRSPLQRGDWRDSGSAIIDRRYNGSADFSSSLRTLRKAA